MTAASPPSPEVGRRATYTGALLTAALMAALAALLLIVLLMRDELSSALADLAQGPEMALAHTRMLMILIAGPMLCAALAALAMWRAIWVMRVTSYMRFIHTYCQDKLRRDAPLLSLGIAPAGRLLDDANSGQTTAARPFADLLGEAPQALVLGDAGAGKTTALLTIAQALSARTAWSRLALGVRRESIPLMISLPGLARFLTESTINAPAIESYLAALLARMGTEGLGARTDQLLKAGRITLLCDDYDRLDDEEREVINGAIGTLREAPYSACRVVVACESMAYASMVDDLGPLAQFRVIELSPVPVTEFTRALEKRRASRRRKPQDDSIDAVLGGDIQQRPIGLSLRLAAVAAALTESQAEAGDSVWGRAEVLRRALRLASASAMQRDLESAVSEPEIEIAQQPAMVWSALAASLHDTRCGWAPLDPSRTVGESVHEWLTNHPPPAPTDFSLNTMPEFSLDRIERDIQAGLRTGTLRRSLDGLTLSFAHTLAQASAAAWWLELRDDGLGRLNTQLLRPQWSLPVALWAGAHAEPYDLAQRIFRFASSPSSIAPRAGLPDSLDVYPQSLALALAAVLEGATPQLMRLIAYQQTHTHAFVLAQQGLRDFLDACVVYGSEPAQRQRLSRALARTQMEVGVEFAAYLGQLAREPHLDRLLRAQITTTLGLSGSSQAVDELMSLLTQSDPTMRQAVEQGLVYAGASAIPALQMVVRTGSAQTRRRAEEALRLLGSVAPADGGATSGAALAGLNSPDAAQRRVAVTTLSAIGASEALNDLIARLDDVNTEVRVAAATALGQLGGRRALLALRQRAASDDAPLRLAVAHALGLDPSPASTTPLIRLLKDRDARVRAAAAASLGAIGDKRALAALREATEDADPWVRHAAQTAVRRYR